MGSDRASSFEARKAIIDMATRPEQSGLEIVPALKFHLVTRFDLVTRFLC